MSNPITNAKKRIYRWIKYRLTRPAPPPLLRGFQGPAVVVGSAPVSHRPDGLDDTYCTITINGSQSATARWGIAVPDITMMMFNQIEGTAYNPREVRRVLRGQRTRALYLLLWRKNERERLERGLAAFDYGYDDLYIVDRYERMALLDKVAGMLTLEIDAPSKCSNGINAVLFALHHGAPAVILTGIDPGSAGHAYNDTGMERLHVHMDSVVLQRLLAAGRPIYTADPEVADATGIPLWTAEHARRHAAARQSGS